MKLDLANEELREIVLASVDRLVADEYSAAIEAVAMEQARQTLMWRTAAQLREEFGLPERSLRALVQDKKVTKSDGLGAKNLVRYLRADVIELLEKGQIKSRTTIAREKAAQEAEKRKVTHFEPPASARGSISALAPVPNCKPMPATRAG